ncbi:hypothetical protein G6F22_018676 [Rhizopus arrhizus]|nr:hypothetical protein G6F22_018676 [Rhizopus arrhizus]
MDTTIHAPNAPGTEDLELPSAAEQLRRVQNLSAVGGAWQAPEYVIDRVVLADDGVLYVDEEHSDDMRPLRNQTTAANRQGWRFAIDHRRPRKYKDSAARTNKSNDLRGGAPRCKRHPLLTGRG